MRQFLPVAANHRLRSFFTLFLLAGLVHGQQAAPAVALSAAETGLAERIKADNIRTYVTALSADDMQGRGTAQPGGDKAAQYIADQFARLKLKPLGEKGGYFQSVKFRDRVWAPETSLKVGSESLKLGSEFIPFGPFSGEENASGDLVYIAYGLKSTTPKRDDLAGVNLSGKIVVMEKGPPRVVSKADWSKYDMNRNILVGLLRAGVRGVIYVQHGREEHQFEENASYAVRRDVAQADDKDYPEELPPFVAVSDSAAEKLFANSGVTFAAARVQAEGSDFKALPLKQKAQIVLKVKEGKGTSNNVVGVLEGSDPKLKDQAIVYTAHYDAYGVGTDGKIYPGAADNGLGVAEMIAVAEAFASAPEKPRRSLIFLAVTGEEYGGLGSTYWVANPTWKVKQIAADLNLDGMGTEVYGPVKSVVGFGAEHSSLGPVLDDVAAANGIKVIPDPMPDEKAFYRSDHYMFVVKGIPGLMLLAAPAGETNIWVDRMKAWEKVDYHQPGDVIKPDWNWEGPRTVATVMAQMGWRLANAEAMPAWNSNSPFNRERGTNEPPPPEP